MGIICNYLPILATEVKILQILEEVKAQVNLNTKLLMKINTENTVEPELPGGIKFPLNDLEDVERVEQIIMSDTDAEKSLAGTLVIFNV